MLLGFIEALEGQGLMLGMLIAAGAGVVSTGACPCTLPFGAGVAAAAGGTEAQSRRSGLALAGMFGLGIVATITILGALAGQAGALLTISFGRYWALAMALLTFAAAMVAFVGVRLKASQLESFRRPGALGGFLYGAVFSLGSATAPLLVLLGTAAAQPHPAHGAALAFTFGIGRALPFLLIALSAGFLAAFLQSPARRKAIQGVSGGVLLAASAYFVWTYFTLL